MIQDKDISHSQRLYTFPFRSTWIPLRVVRSCYLIIGFLWSVLWIIVCPLFLFFWSLHCQFFFDLRLLITPLVSSNFSLKCYHTFICPLQHQIKPRHDITEMLFKVALNTIANLKSNVLPLYLPMTFKRSH